ncbi:DUF6191 domain-containing protein [Streptomyces shenzhenensis]|uniref:DUF6191 domain-containing protein n=1 Tax=Streptomyces shenzhenensis TaxID=943815 RepID=UPI0037D9C554
MTRVRQRVISLDPRAIRRRGAAPDVRLCGAAPRRGAGNCDEEDGAPPRRSAVDLDGGTAVIRVTPGRPRS